jgi:hypothetical protein
MFKKRQGYEKFVYEQTGLLSRTMHYLVVWSTKLSYLPLPVLLFPQKLVDLVIHVPDFVFTQGSWNKYTHKIRQLVAAHPGSKV